MSALLRAVRSYAHHHELLRPGPLVLAVSGGTDSTALCLLLAELREEFGLVLRVAHFDHRTRPRAAPADAAFVAELANHIGAPLRIGRADTAPKNEDDARRARYDFLRRVAREIGATAIATGHTRDDQAETVLLHLARGSGIAGLAGMRPEREGIVRPLLCIGRADTTAVCKAARVRAREDPSNRSLRFARNRIRQRVLPELAKLNPEIAEAIARLAEAAAAITDTADTRTAASLEAAVADDTVDLARLPADHDARAAALAKWWERRTGRLLTARNRDALMWLASSTSGSQAVDLPGGRALREYAHLRRASEKQPIPADGPIALEPGQVVNWHGWRFALDREMVGAEIARVDTDRIIVRGRRPGDRMSGPGRPKVQDVFTNAKVPARERDTWPLVTADEQVVWIPGITRPPRDGQKVLRALRSGDDTGGVTRGDSKQVASLLDVRPLGTEKERVRRRT